jgi:hypothetical protein
VARWIADIGTGFVASAVRLKPRPLSCAEGCDKVGRMPIYFFNVRGVDFEVPDTAGRLCADAAAARREAESMAADLVRTALDAGTQPLDAVIEVDDEEQRPVLALPLRDVRI